MLKRDSFQLGTFIGVLVPLAFFGLLYVINLLIESLFMMKDVIRINTLQLVSIAMNALVLRYYLVKLKFDKTGRGILLITFVYIFLFFFFNHKW